MAEIYQTPPSLVDAERRLNEALDELKQNLDDVEALSGVANAFSDASDANKAAVAGFLEASRSFETSLADTSASLKSLAQSIEESQREFSESLSRVRKELSDQNKKIDILKFLLFAPIVLIVILLVRSFSL